MSFQEIVKIEKYDFYLDLAFRRAKDKVKKTISRKRDPLKKAIELELIRINTIKDTLKKHFSKILISFPSLDGLTEFYQELVKVSVDYRYLKKSLGAVNWLVKKINFFSGFYAKKIKQTKIRGRIDQLRREYYGRISSLVRQIKNELDYLDEARKIIKEFPVIKSNIKTVVVIGFPNVGKTTLLFRLTGSKPEINSYPFTTKKINVSYIEGKEKIQLLDVPGTLNRFDKMNNIEKQARLAVKYLADQLIYVFDITEPYPLKDQIKLLKQTKKQYKNIILFLSKVDLLKKDDIDEFKKKFDVVTKLDDLKIKLELE